LILFHQAILENDLPTITNMYEQGWNKLTNVGHHPFPAYFRNTTPKMNGQRPR